MRVVVTLSALLLAWEAAVRVLAMPAYLLPGPLRIAQAFARSSDVILSNAAVTLLEIVLGLASGICTGILAAVLMSLSPRLRAGVGPLLPIAQAIPVFAIAPLLVTWLGFDLAPKIVMATLIIFFPVATALFEGLRRTDQGLIDFAALSGAGPLRTLFLIRFPSALPSLASGLRVAAGVAPVAAIVGEWVGSSAGLGHLMLHANARAQTDLVFACLVVLLCVALALWCTMELALNRLLHWAPETLRVSPVGAEAARP